MNWIFKSRGIGKVSKRKREGGVERMEDKYLFASSPDTKYLNINQCVIVLNDTDIIYIYILFANTHTHTQPDRYLYAE